MHYMQLPKCYKGFKTTSEHFVRPKKSENQQNDAVVVSVARFPFCVTDSSRQKFKVMLLKEQHKKTAAICKQNKNPDYKTTDSQIERKKVTKNKNS